MHTRFLGLDKSLSDEVQVVLYRAAQEGLTNIARHAEAKSAEITIAWKGEHIPLQVSDDGKRMDTRGPFGLGLMGMQERVRLLGGRIWFFSQEAGGFTINILLGTREHRTFLTAQNGGGL